MSSILFPRCGKSYEGALLERLLDLKLPIVEFVAEDDFKTYFEAICCEKREDSIVIIDIENEKAVRGILQVIPTAITSSRIVVITTLLTWCGERSAKAISDVETGFINRTPLQSSLNIYALENMLWKAATDTASSGVVVCFAGFGLLYGRGGKDFEETYKTTWNDMCTNSDDGNFGAVRLPLLDPETKGDNILAIHLDTFLDSIIHLARDYEFISSPKYFSLVDDCQTSTVNCHAFETNQPIIGMPRDSVIARLWEDPRLMLLNAKVWFRQNQLTALVAACTESSWGQFLSYHRLAPCRIMIAGAPFCGKTEIGKKLSSKLDLKYVDVAGSLRWVACQKDENEATRSLMELMNAHLAAGAKKGGAPVVIDPLTFDFSPTFTASLPNTILRRCISQHIATCSHCNIKGFVLDVWSVPDLIANGLEFCELFNVVAPINTDQTQESAGGTLTISTKLVTDVIVLEVESGDKRMLIDRCMKSIGISEADNKAKLPKEVQATLKDFESRLDKYWLKLRETERIPGAVATDSEQPPPATRLSYGALLDAHDTVHFRSSSLDDIYQATVDDAVAHTLEDTVKRLHGAMGWLPASSMETNDDAVATGQTAPAATILPGTVSDFVSTATVFDAIANAAIVTATSDDTVGDDLRQINIEIGGLGEEERKNLVSTCAELSEYLEVNVTPFLAKCLINIERQRPEDPVSFLIDFLEEQSATNQADARDHAHKTFCSELEQAEVRYHQEMK